VTIDQIRERERETMHYRGTLGERHLKEHLSKSPRGWMQVDEKDKTIDGVEKEGKKYRGLAPYKKNPCQFTSHRHTC
jgi:hypothetical protein